MRSAWRTSTFKAALALLVALAAGAAAAHPARGIVVAPDDTVTFSDLERIWRIAPDGRLSIARSHRGIHTHALALTAEGDLLGEDSDYRAAGERYVESIWKLTRAGRLSYVRRPSPTLTRGVGLLRGRNGCSYHADQTAQHRPLLHRVCPGRPAERLFGSAADDRAFRPVLINDVAGTAFAPDGSFLFRHGTLIYRYAPRTGVTVRARGIAPENFGIAVDRSNNLFVAEFARRRVLRVTPAGQRSVAMASEAPWGPTGVAVGRRGLVVLEATHYRRGSLTQMRVRRVDPTGGVQTLAAVTIPAA
jgi:hypothetical protein